MELLQFYKCLADQTRLKSLFLIVHEGELCVCELTEALNELQPKVSRHLAVLKSSGLLLDRRDGPWIYYRLNPNIPAWAKNTLYTSYKENPAYIQPNLNLLLESNERPGRMKARI